MGSRGVTRGMGGDGSGDHEHGPPYSDARHEMLRSHHARTLWVYWTLILLGVWTVLAPFNFGYLNAELWVDPSGGRGVWFSDDAHTGLRAWLMTLSDVSAGFVLIIAGVRALRPDTPVSLWIAAGAGAWLSAAPVIFWAPVAAAYVNGTLVGMLVLALTVLIPGMPNMILFMKMGGEVPPGWTYNPSSWAQRWIMIVLGFAGLLASRYLAMYQMGYVQDVWDPFFGEASRRVLDSPMSHSLPVSDAGLGALAYTFEFLMGFMGSPARWRTMPWMVALFGILVIPLGLVHIFLVISQPVTVGAWCTFCLLAAAIMLPMIPLEVDEVIAMLQHVRRRMREEGFWNVFWKGGSGEEAESDERSPAIATFSTQPLAVARASFWGMSTNWGLVLTALIGVGLMAMPDLFGIAKPASVVYHLGGALVTVNAVIAMGEPLRALRFLNVAVGLGVAVLPWVLTGAAFVPAATASVSGLIVAGASLLRGPIGERFGGWDRLIV